MLFASFHMAIKENIVMSLDWQLGLIFVFIIILISLQYTLNRIFVVLKEILSLMHLLVNRK